MNTSSPSGANDKNGSLALSSQSKATTNNNVDKQGDESNHEAGQDKINNNSPSSTSTSTPSRASLLLRRYASSPSPPQVKVAGTDSNKDNKGPFAQLPNSDKANANANTNNETDSNSKDDSGGSGGGALNNDNNRNLDRNKNKSRSNSGAQGQRPMRYIERIHKMITSLSTDKPHVAHWCDLEGELSYAVKTRIITNSRELERHRDRCSNNGVLGAGASTEPEPAPFDTIPLYLEQEILKEEQRLLKLSKEDGGLYGQGHDDGHDGNGTTEIDDQFSFVIQNKSRFGELLHTFGFDTSNFASFERQLNNYNFHKVQYHAPGTTPSSSSANTKSPEANPADVTADPSPIHHTNNKDTLLCFYHPFFHREASANELSKIIPKRRGDQYSKKQRAARAAAAAVLKKAQEMTAAAARKAESNSSSSSSEEEDGNANLRAAEGSSQGEQQPHNKNKQGTSRSKSSRKGRGVEPQGGKIQKSSSQQNGGDGARDRVEDLEEENVRLHRQLDRMERRVAYLEQDMRLMMDYSELMMARDRRMAVQGVGVGVGAGMPYHGHGNIAAYNGHVPPPPPGGGLPSLPPCAHPGPPPPHPPPLRHYPGGGGSSGAPAASEHHPHHPGMGAGPGPGVHIGLFQSSRTHVAGGGHGDAGGGGDCGSSFGEQQLPPNSNPTSVHVRSSAAAEPGSPCTSNGGRPPHARAAIPPDGTFGRTGGGGGAVGQSYAIRESSAMAGGGRTGSGVSHTQTQSHAQAERHRYHQHQGQDVDENTPPPGRLSGMMEDVANHHSATKRRRLDESLLPARRASLTQEII
jgi:hypothetical protein